MISREYSTQKKIRNIAVLIAVVVSFVFVATFANTSRVDAYTTMTIKVSSITKTSATVSWSGCSGTAQYEVCIGEKVYKNTTKKSMKITGLKKGCTYYTKVNALNKKGNAIGSTKWVKFTTKK